MVTNLKQAKKSDVSTIIQFLKEMNDETKEFNFDKKLFTQSVTNSFDENVHWFLFMDERKTPFDLCYLQSVHNYWRLEKRFYLGGFYITSSHRKKGYFKTLNQQLKDWANDNHGVQIYVHINEHNQHSIDTFTAAGFKKIEYDLFVNHWGED